jgi:hypothetical protein
MESSDEAERAFGEREKAGTVFQLQGPDEVAANISAIEKAVGLPPLQLLALNREAIRDLGCRIVAQALEKSDGSSVGFG